MERKERHGCFLMSVLCIAVFDTNEHRRMNPRCFCVLEDKYD